MKRLHQEKSMWMKNLFSWKIVLTLQELDGKWAETSCSNCDSASEVRECLGANWRIRRQLSNRVTLAPSYSSWVQSSGFSSAPELELLSLSMSKSLQKSLSVSLVSELDTLDVKVMSVEVNPMALTFSVELVLPVCYNDEPSVSWSSQFSVKLLVTLWQLQGLELSRDDNYLVMFMAIPYSDHRSYILTVAQINTFQWSANLKCAACLYITWHVLICSSTGVVF